MKEEVKLYIYSADITSELNLPYVDDGIKAGFPSPAQDYLTETIDLNKTLIKHTETTFYAKVSGDSMKDAGISDGDLVVIDKSLEARNGDFVAAYIDGDFTLKRYEYDEVNHCAWLIPANDKYEPIKVTEDNSFRVWGIGHRSMAKLTYHGIRTAWDLTQKSESWTRRELTVTGVRTFS